MTESAQHIPDELTCPNCAYDLRGIDRTIVTCPECGAAINIDTLTRSLWNGPPWRAPLYRKHRALVFTATWFVLIMAIMSSYIAAEFPHPVWTMLGLLAFPCGLWLGCMVYCARKLGGYGKALVVILGALIPIGTLAGILGCVGGGIGIVIWAYDGRMNDGTPVLLGVLAGGIGLLAITHVVEGFIARKYERAAIRRAAIERYDTTDES